MVIYLQEDLLSRARRYYKINLGRIRLTYQDLSLVYFRIAYSNVTFPLTPASFVIVRNLTL